MNPATKKPRFCSLYAGVFLISMASLGFEVSLTRIFSVVMGHHFAYLVISMALLGYGSAGTFLAIKSGFLRKNARTRLSNSCILFSLSIIFSYIIANRVRFDPVNFSWNPAQMVNIFIDFFVLSIPFFFSGLIISGSIYIMSNLVGKIYFADMGGAAAGCFIPCVLFPLFSRGEAVVVLLSAVGLLSSVIFYNSRCFASISMDAESKDKDLSNKTMNNKTAAFPLLAKIMPAAFLIAFLFLITPSILDMKISPYRDIMQALRHESSQITHTEWGISSRIDVIDSPAVRYAPGLSFKYLEPLPYQMGVTIDGGNLQAVTFQQDGKMDFFDYLPSSLPYKLKKAAGDGFTVLVISPGGGLELQSALYYGAGNVVGTESNPELAAYVNEFFRKNIHLHESQHITVYPEVGRCFLKRTGQKYDIIQIPLTNVFGASSGVFSSGVNYDLTVEAFREYYNSLENGGYISVTSYLRPVPVEEARLLSIIFESLKGMADPKKSTALIRSWGALTFAVKKGEFEDKEINTIREFCRERNFDPVYFPGIKEEETNIYNRFKEPIYYHLVLNMLDEESRKKYIAGHIFNIAPVTDDSPFFHNLIRLDRLREIYESTGGKWTIILEGGFIPPLITVQALVLSFLLIILPHITGKSRRNIFIYSGNQDRKDVKKDRTSVLCLLGYFILIGTAYMFIEISLLHRLQVLFGSMSYSVSLVLSALLVSSGLGSFLISDRIRGGKRGATIVLPIILTVLIVLYTIFIGAFIDILMGASLAARTTGAAVLLFPAGFLMGTFFPYGMSLATKTNKKLIPWLWCANGSASVTAAPLSISIAVYSGFSPALAAAGIFYAIASFLIYVHGRSLSIKLKGTHPYTGGILP